MEKRQQKNGVGRLHRNGETKCQNLPTSMAVLAIQITLGISAWTYCANSRRKKSMLDERTMYEHLYRSASDHSTRASSKLLFAWKQPDLPKF